MAHMPREELGVCRLYPVWALPFSPVTPPSRASVSSLVQRGDPAGAALVGLSRGPVRTVEQRER